MEGKGLSQVVIISILVLLTVFSSFVITHYYSHYVKDNYTCNSDICIMCKDKLCGAFLKNTTLPGWYVVENCGISCDHGCRLNCNLTKPKKISNKLQISGIVLNISEYYNLTR